MHWCPDETAGLLAILAFWRYIPQYVRAVWARRHQKPACQHAPGFHDRPRCNYQPIYPGYAPCTRAAGHDGPCAHHEDK